MSIGYANISYNVHLYKSEVMYHANWPYLNHKFFMVSIVFVSYTDRLPGMVGFQDAPRTSAQVINGSSNKMSMPLNKKY